MLSELRTLLAACPEATSIGDFRAAIVDENVLGKRTITTRKESLRRLRELYGLTFDVTLFRVLRNIWVLDVEAQPLIALLCAAARDPILRATADVILDAPLGDRVTPQQIEAGVERAFRGRYNPTMLANIGRHAASSWQQSGHLEGRQMKTRTRTTSRPVATAYALLLGEFCGGAGEGLFTTFWMKLLDAPNEILHEQAFAASRLGLIDYRKSGGITQVGFGYLMDSETASV